MREPRMTEARIAACKSFFAEGEEVYGSEIGAECVNEIEALRTDLAAAQAEIERLNNRPGLVADIQRFQGIIRNHEQVIRQLEDEKKACVMLVKEGHDE